MSEEKKEITFPATANNLITAHFSKIKDRFLQLKDEETFIKESSFAMQICQSNSMLKTADAMSVLNCVINLAQTDLTLNPVLKLAYLIPYREGGAVKCRIEPSYQGLVKLVTDTGSARSIFAHPVFEGDEFEVSLGTGVEIIHRPKFKSKNLTHVYAVAILSDGSKQVEVMTLSDIKEIREMSESFKSYEKGKGNPANSWKSCIWVDHFEEMSKKTVIKRLVKYLPKTEMWSKLGHAIKLDNEDFGATDGQLQLIDSIIIEAAIGPEELERIQYQIDNGMTREEASELIGFLKANKIDPIEAGQNYGQTEVRDKVANKLNDPKA